MTIYKDLNNEISNFNDWERFFNSIERNKGKWKEGYSAAELAKEYTDNQGKQLNLLLNANEEFKNIVLVKGFPEYGTKFDEFKGGIREHDLVIIGNVNDENVLITIEAKVDESLGPMIGTYYAVNKAKKLSGIPTNIPNRVEGLIQSLTNLPINDLESSDSKLFNLRYQLFTAVAGTLAEAKLQGAKKALFIIQGFNIKSGKVEKDINNFIEVLTGDPLKTLDNNQIIEIGTVKGSDFIPSDVSLYIGKLNVRV